MCFYLIFSTISASEAVKTLKLQDVTRIMPSDFIPKGLARFKLTSTTNFCPVISSGDYFL